ncbi:MAG: GrpB family protein [Dehalococcoidia bacterium]
MLADEEPVLVVKYDPEWPRRYEEERARIITALGGLIAGIEHVGSTAVPGLGGKPVIDIMIGVARFEDGERCVAPLEGLGYEYRGEAGIPGRLFFRKGQPRTHQVHLVEQGRDFWEDHLLFRDFLRVHTEIAEDYYNLKKELAAKFRTDREVYADAKTPFIQAVLDRARAAQAP